MRGSSANAAGRSLHVDTAPVPIVAGTNETAGRTSGNRPKAVSFCLLWLFWTCSLILWSGIREHQTKPRSRGLLRCLRTWRMNLGSVLRPAINMIDRTPATRLQSRRCKRCTRRRTYGGAVSTVIVQFGNTYTDDDERFLGRATRWHGNRRVRHEIACANADRAQRRVLEFLRSDATAAVLFRGKPALPIRGGPTRSLAAGDEFNRRTGQLEARRAIVGIRRGERDRPGCADRLSIARRFCASGVGDFRRPRREGWCRARVHLGLEAPRAR